MSGMERLKQYYMTTWKNLAFLIEACFDLIKKRNQIREQTYIIFALLSSSEFELLIQRISGWRADNVIGNRWLIKTNHWPWQLTSWLGYDDTRDPSEEKTYFWMAFK